MVVGQGGEEEAALVTAALTCGVLSYPRQLHWGILSAGGWGDSDVLDEPSSVRMISALAAGAGRIRNVQLVGFCLTGPSTTSLLSAVPGLAILDCSWVLKAQHTLY